MKTKLKQIDSFQFQRICDELQRTLNREKQAEDLLNEQNQQLKSLTDILHQTQQEKYFIEKQNKDKIEQLTKSHRQTDENVQRAEKAIRLVVK